MAAIAIIVGRDADRDRLARARGRVAMSTSIRRPAFSGLVSGVVKFHVKALDELCGESIHRGRRGLGVLMTDRADDLVFVSKLVEMTANARFVAGIAHLKRAALALVARVTGELLMLRDLVRKGLKCLIRDALRYRFRRFRRGQRYIRLWLLLDAARRKDGKCAENKQGLQQLYWTRSVSHFSLQGAGVGAAFI